MGICFGLAFKAIFPGLTNIEPWWRLPLYIAIAVLGLTILFNAYQFLGPVTRAWYQRYRVVRLINTILSWFLALTLGFLVWEQVFNIPSWRLDDSTYMAEVAENLSFWPNWIILAIFLYGFSFSIWPLLTLFILDITQFAKFLWSTFGTRLRRAFHLGADTIEKITQWSVLIAVVVYITYDRDREIIESAFQTLVRFEDQVGDFGRKDAIENLVARNEGIVGADLKHATLAELDLTRSAFFYRKIRPNLSLSDFTNANLRAAHAPCSLFRGAKFNGASLRDAVFVAANLERAEIRNAEFGGSHFFEFTDFSFANLRGADLRHDASGPLSSLDSIEAYDTGRQTIASGGAFLIGADLRGAKLGPEVLGVHLLDRVELVARETSGLVDASDSEKLFFQDFPVLTVLSASRWDATTVFPDVVAQRLRQLGLRDGRADTTEEKANLDRAREWIEEAYRMVYGEQRTQLVRGFRFQRGLVDSTDSSLADITGVVGSRNLGDPTAILCSDAHRELGRALTHQKPLVPRELVYSSFTERRQTSLQRDLPYPLWLPPLFEVCSLLNVPAGSQATELSELVPERISIPFERVIVHRESVPNGKSAVVGLDFEFTNKADRDAFHEEVSTELELAGHLNRIDGSYILHEYLVPQGDVPLWVDFGRDVMSITLFDEASATGLSESAVSILEAGLVGALPAPLPGSDACPGASKAPRAPDPG